MKNLKVHTLLAVLGFSISMSVASAANFAPVAPLAPKVFDDLTKFREAKVLGTLRNNKAPVTIVTSVNGESILAYSTDESQRLTRDELKQVTEKRAALICESIGQEVENYNTVEQFQQETVLNVEKNMKFSRVTRVGERKQTGSAWVNDYCQSYHYVGPHRIYDGEYACGGAYYPQYTDYKFATLRSVNCQPKSPIEPLRKVTQRLSSEKNCEKAQTIKTTLLDRFEKSAQVEKDMIRSSIADFNRRCDRFATAGDAHGNRTRN